MAQMTTITMLVTADSVLARHESGGLLDALYSILDHFGPPIFAKRPPKRRPFCDK